MAEKKVMEEKDLELEGEDDLRIYDGMKEHRKEVEYEEK